MNYFEKQWKSIDGVPLFARIWSPSDSPKYVINIVHGLGEHGGRYASWAQKFNDAQMAFVAMDYRGHGKSGGKRGHAPSYEALLNDISVSLDEVSKEFGGVPVILYGHSLGGNLVLYHTMFRNPPIAGLVVTSPWLRLSSEPPVWKLLPARIIRPLFPALTIPNGLNPADLSHNEEVVRAYTADPLVHSQISLRLVFDVMNAAEKIIHGILPSNLPVLMAHGLADRITSPVATQEFVHRAGKNVTFRLYKDMFHELHNEACAPELFAFIHQWITEHFADASDRTHDHGYF